MSQAGLKFPIYLSVSAFEGLELRLWSTIPSWNRFYKVLSQTAPFPNKQTLNLNISVKRTGHVGTAFNPSTGRLRQRQMGLYELEFSLVYTISSNTQARTHPLTCSHTYAHTLTKKEEEEGKLRKTASTFVTKMGAGHHKSSPTLS